MHTQKLLQAFARPFYSDDNVRQTLVATHRGAWDDPRHGHFALLMYVKSIISRTRLGRNSQPSPDRMTSVTMTFVTPQR